MLHLIMHCHKVIHTAAVFVLRIVIHCFTVLSCCIVSLVTMLCTIAVSQLQCNTVLCSVGMSG